MAGWPSGVYYGGLSANDSVNWCNASHLHSEIDDRARVSAYLTLGSSMVSLVGSSLIVASYLFWPDMRSVARAILVFLAISDFATAAGYMFGAGVFLRYYNQTDSTNPSYMQLCKTQSFITTFFPVSSFFWTAYLAVFLFTTIVLRKTEAARRMLLPFHITAWGIPLLVCVPAVATGILGPALSRTSTSWCFVAFNETYPASTSQYNTRMAKYYGFEFLCGKLWELLAYVVAVLLYVTTELTLHCRVSM